MIGRLRLAQRDLSLESLLVVSRKELDDYDDNYVRRHRGPIRVRFEESNAAIEIGDIEVWYIDGSRAVDNGLDIADVCDSLGQLEAVYAAAVYTDGSIDSSIVENPLCNDVLVIHSLSLQVKYRGQQLETYIIRKIAETIGYHSGAVVFVPERVGVTDRDEFERVPTKDSLIYYLTDF